MKLEKRTVTLSIPITQNSVVEDLNLLPHIPMHAVPGKYFVKILTKYFLRAKQTVILPAGVLPGAKGFNHAQKLRKSNEQKYKKNIEFE